MEVVKYIEMELVVVWVGLRASTGQVRMKTSRGFLVWRMDGRTEGIGVLSGNSNGLECK